jgi:hypothetical protein
VKWSELSTEERDRLVHTKVMGKAITCTGIAVTKMVKNPSRIAGEYFEYPTWHCDTCGREEPRAAPKERDIPGDIPSYSTDMNAALLVATHERFSHTYFNHIRASQLYSCSLYWLKSGEAQITTELAPLLPEAICIAALKACGVEVEE